MRPNPFLKGRSGIYGIRNCVNGKIYVGKTNCFYQRCRQYVYDFNYRRLDHINNYLLNAMVKVGIEDFEFFPLEFCSNGQLAELELQWIIKLNSTDRKVGYNLRMDSSSGMLASLETSEKIRANLIKQWADGKRKDHSKKLKANWSGNSKRKLLQSGVMTKALTKYKYSITTLLGENVLCDFKGLKWLKLQNVVATFHKKDKDTVTFKGHIITRIKMDKENE